MTAPRARSSGPFGTHARRISAAEFRITVSRATVPKEELPEHIHVDGQIILAVDPGYLSRAFDRDAQGEGFDLVYNPPGTVHRDCFFDVGGRFLSVAVPRQLAPLGDDPVHLRGGSARDAAGRLLAQCLQTAPSPTVLEQVTLELLGDVTSVRTPSQPPAWLRDAEELIVLHATRPAATVAEIAGILGLHPVYFARAYRAAHGYGPAKSLQRNRIAQAVALLSRDRTLAEVAADCGFSDQSHLSRSLRTVFAATPTQVRDAFDPELRMFKTGALARA